MKTHVGQKANIKNNEVYIIILLNQSLYKLDVYRI